MYRSTRISTTRSITTTKITKNIIQAIMSGTGESLERLPDLDADPRRAAERLGERRQLPGGGERCATRPRTGTE